MYLHTVLFIEVIKILYCIVDFWLQASHHLPIAVGFRLPNDSEGFVLSSVFDLHPTDIGWNMNKIIFIVKNSSHNSEVVLASTDTCATPTRLNLYSLIAGYRLIEKVLISKSLFVLVLENLYHLVDPLGLVLTSQDFAPSFFPQVPEQRPE